MLGYLLTKVHLLPCLGAYFASFCLRCFVASVPTQMPLGSSVFLAHASAFPAWSALGSIPCLGSHLLHPLVWQLLALPLLVSFFVSAPAWAGLFSSVSLVPTHVALGFSPCLLGPLLHPLLIQLCSPVFLLPMLKWFYVPAQLG